MNEKWKSIHGYEGYEVSSCGRVRSFKNFHNGLTEKPRILKQTESIHGYPYVSLVKNGKPKKHVVHRLVAAAFVSNSKNKPQVNHIDGNKTNNWSSNLEWCTKSENEAHAYKNNLKASTEYHKRRSREANTGENNHSSILAKKDVLRIKQLIESGEITQREIAKRYKVSPSTITAIKKGRAWGHL